MINNPAEQQNPILSPWPFTQWGIDIIGPLSMARGQVKFTVIAVDYFTKWAEAEPLDSQSRYIRFIMVDFIPILQYPFRDPWGSVGFPTKVWFHNGCYLSIIRVSPIYGFPQ